MRPRFLFDSLLFALAAFGLVAMILGCCPRSCGAEFDAFGPSVAFAAFQPADCGCGSGAACTCAPGQCHCVTARACPNKNDGIVTDATAAFASQRDWNCPVVEFRNQPARTVYGAVSYRYDGKQDKAAGVVAFAADGRGYRLPADATESAILTALNPGRPVVGHTKVCTESGCRLVPQFGEPAYTVPVAYFGGRAYGPCGPNG